MPLTWLVTEPTTDVSLQVSDILTNLSDIPTNLSDILTNLSEALTKVSDLPTKLTDLPTNLSDILTKLTDLPTKLTDLPTNLGEALPEVGTDEPVEASQRQQQHDELSPVLHPCGSGGCSGCIGIDHVPCLRCVPQSGARRPKPPQNEAGNAAPVNLGVATGRVHGEMGRQKSAPRRRESRAD